MKNRNVHTREEFYRLNKEQLHNIWFREAKTDRQIAKIYGVTKEEVKQRRIHYGLTYMKSAMLYLLGGEKYRDK